MLFADWPQAVFTETTGQSEVLSMRCWRRNWMVILCESGDGII